MRLLKWEYLPKKMQNSQVEKYYNKLKKKKTSLFFKRFFDIFASLILLLLLLPLFIVIIVCIKLDSRGPAFYKQERVTQYDKKFKIIKFRTMVQNADKIGTQITLNNDNRITRVGRILRKTRLDELPQLINVFLGDMTFVGTRPEVPKYTKEYTSEMLATLLLPAGITSRTSIFYKNESELLDASESPEKTYVEEILPAKMRYNLKSLCEFGFWHDIKTLFMTIFSMLGKKYKEDSKKSTTDDLDVMLIKK